MKRMTDFNVRLLARTRMLRPYLSYGTILKYYRGEVARLKAYAMEYYANKPKSMPNEERLQNIAVYNTMSKYLEEKEHFAIIDKTSDEERTKQKKIL